MTTSTPTGAPIGVLVVDAGRDVSDRTRGYVICIPNP
jgi:hypothetical protein